MGGGADGMFFLVVYDTLLSDDGPMDMQAWSLLEKGHLFPNRPLETDLDHAHRFAEIISLLGPPPLEFLRRSEESLKYWDEHGKSTRSYRMSFANYIQQETGEVLSRYPKDHLKIESVSSKGRIRWFF